MIVLSLRPRSGNGTNLRPRLSNGLCESGLVPEPPQDVRLLLELADAQGRGSTDCCLAVRGEATTADYCGREGGRDCRL